MGRSKQGSDTQRTSRPDSALYARRVELLYQNARSVLAVVPLGGLIVVLAVRVRAPTGVLAAWFVSLCLLTGLRLLLAHRYRRASPPLEEASRWAAYFVAGAGLSGALWGTAGVLFFSPGSLALQSFLAFVLGGMVAGAAAAYAPLLAAYFAFAVPALLPITVDLAAAGEGPHLAMAGVLLLFFLMMTVISRRIRAIAVASLRLGTENAELIRVLRDEKERADGINEELAAEIEEKERAEAEVRRHRDHLQDLVRERTAGLGAANEQLSRAKNEWERTFDTVPDLIAILDLKFRIRRLNRALAAAIGVEPREAIGLACFEVFHGEPSPPSDCPYARLLEDGKAHSGEIYAEKFGRHYLASTSPLRGPEGELTGAVLVARDISDLKRVQEDLVAERNRLAVTLESIGDAVVVTDAEGRVTLLNAVAEALTKWRRAEAVGRPLRELFQIVGERDRQPRENPADRVLAGGKAVDIGASSVLVTKDGTERVIADSSAPIRAADGALVGTVFVFRDVTDQRRMEEEFARTQHLEALGVLAGGIAHDFNNIFSGIAANLHRVRQVGTLGQEELQPLERAEEACFRARNLTQQLLTFARGGEPVRRVLDVGKVLPEWVDFASRGSPVRAEVDVEPDLAPVEADEHQIQQVVSNLMINAQQAMPGGGVVRVRARNESVEDGVLLPLLAGRYLCISVEDEGVGIAPENLARIFHPYFTTKASGSGLGLATAYSIVNRHGGHIVVRSKPGEGSRFSVYLPALKEPAPAAYRPARAAAVRRGAGRILVMDDEALIRETLGEILPEIGYEAQLAADGTRAVELYRNAFGEGRPFDAVLLDLTVPGGMGGKEAVEQLRAINPDVRAIASSGYASDPVLAEPARFGFAATIAKPYRISELAEVLHRVLAGPREAAEDR